MEDAEGNYIRVREGEWGDNVQIIYGDNRGKICPVEKILEEKLQLVVLLDSNTEKSVSITVGCKDVRVISMLPDDIIEEWHENTSVVDMFYDVKVSYPATHRALLGDLLACMIRTYHDNRHKNKDDDGLKKLWENIETLAMFMYAEYPINYGE